MAWAAVVRRMEGPDMNETKDRLSVRTATYRHTKLESIEATFPHYYPADAPKPNGETKLTITIEQSEGDFHDGGGFTDREVPRMRINPSHGFAGYSRAESMWIQEMIPKLWAEWEARVMK